MNYQETIDVKLAEAEKLIGVPLTDKEKKEFQYHTVGAIVGIKMIRAMSADDLKAALKDKAKHEELRQRVGAGTNPTWVTGQVAEALYMSGEIGEKVFDAINEFDGLEIPL